MVEEALLKVFCTNFVAYYKSHAAHVNVTGRNFVSDHELLNKIYDDLQDEIDTLAELLRTIDVEMPESLSETIDNSLVMDTGFSTELSEDYLRDVMDDLNILIDVHHALEAVTDSIEFSHLNNYAQDRVKTLHKFIWMLKATLSPRIAFDIDKF